MKYLLTVLCVCCISVMADAQQYQAWIIDVNSHQPVADVVVSNRQNGALALSDSNGRFVISGRRGQMLQYSHTAYEAHRTVIGELGTDTIYLVRFVRTLGEVTVVSEEERFRRDSILRRQIYAKTLEEAGSKPSFEVGGGPTGYGIGVSGLVTETALRLSGRKRAARKFERMMLADERERYTGIRYNTSLVMRTIPVDDSTANAFIARHPVPYEFIRQASDLELKMWIRERWEQEQKEVK